MENPSFVRLAEMVAVGLYSSSSAGAFKPASSELLGHAHGSSDGRFSSGDWGNAIVLLVCVMPTLPRHDRSRVN